MTTTADMTHRQLGDSGLTVSAVGLGCNNFGRRLDQDATTAVVRAALDAGITLFDTADIYGMGASEEQLGVALGAERENVVVATKFGMDMQGANGPDWGSRGSRRYVRKAVEASLRRLGTDWIDLYQLHRPDPHTPVGETLAALDELVREGKVRYLGSSNFTAWQVVDADWVARSEGRERFVSAQNEYSLLERDVEDELVPACEHVGVGLLPYFPLASGLLTGKYRRDEKAPEGTRLASMDDRLAAADWDTVEALQAYADARDLRLVDVAIGGLAAQPAVASVIAGATSAEQVADNVRAGSWHPSPDDLAELDEITAPD
ncbi:aryl-alcohol dehydrogenase-like predicted oxidoreductase [Terracoccus luteus]|uniref:Aryl-alcohol dehydrogenase-like predicted oxidoreductase n=2 Tax=Terracoccus luteus TaxID=53356 RepID=A0A839PNT0_9MICO|nr:aryl-alcohol dehydrogenase-like predicted oxidoreductase [Terracoccus luteus]MCP2171590.1 aryl-alcohol dehydrogenase-like predicted oxidoreductase [Terracoccus luteus]